MPRKRKAEITMSGGQLLGSGDVIQVMEQGRPVKCLVLSCLGKEDGTCLASLEILEGERKGKRISTTLRPEPPVQEDS